MWERGSGGDILETRGAHIKQHRVTLSFHKPNLSNPMVLLSLILTPVSMGTRCLTVRPWDNGEVFRGRRWGEGG